MHEETRQSPGSALWAGFRRFCRELFGDAKYDTYVRHLRRTHPEQPVPTVAEF